MTIDTVLARVTTSPSAAPVEVVTPIKPSEAIRLGCLIAPEQAFGLGTVEPGGAACALAAMSLALGWGGGDIDSRVPFDMTDELSGVAPPCDHVQFDGQAYVGRSAVWHLNDRHRWSRERIADYLEGLGL